ncbi:phytoene/squalene synthase family protein [Kriegella sp. EG-1]|nr:phytoene/squalene synthase family protein [Flavobacteriaceae bacterium EG-1]
MKKLFDNSSYDCSKLVTKTYSTSFSMGIKLFSPKIRPAIYAIYGFVRYADEIVDTFHDYQQETLFNEFEQDYYKAYNRKISLNPILNAFQEIAHKYDLKNYVQDFLDRMRMDLDKTEYKTVEEYENYIYGSADVVGLMCLRVFVDNDEIKFQDLKGYAMRLGSAFQKVNFLRDIKQDNEDLGRSYFPNLENGELTEKSKAEIILDVENDFKEAYKGIVLLPLEGKLGVYLAYRYYLRLLQKIKRSDCKRILKGRIRISNSLKLVLLTKAILRYRLNVI